MGGLAFAAVVSLVRVMRSDRRLDFLGLTGSMLSDGEARLLADALNALPASKPATEAETIELLQAGLAEARGGVDPRLALRASVKIGASAPLPPSRRRLTGPTRSDRPGRAGPDRARPTGPARTRRPFRRNKKKLGRLEHRESNRGHQQKEQTKIQGVMHNDHYTKASYVSV